MKRYSLHEAPLKVDIYDSLVRYFSRSLFKKTILFFSPLFSFYLLSLSFDFSTSNNSTKCENPLFLPFPSFNVNERHPLYFFKAPPRSLHSHLYYFISSFQNRLPSFLHLLFYSNSKREKIVIGCHLWFLFIDSFTFLRLNQPTRHVFTMSTSCRPPSILVLTPPQNCKC